MNSDDDTHRWVGCPIRISTDQSLLAAPHGFSQRATSFVASWCQGIHRMPLSRSRSTHAQEPPTPRIARCSCCAGRLTPLSALPVLTARRPLRSSTGTPCDLSTAKSRTILRHGLWLRPGMPGHPEHTLLSRPEHTATTGPKPRLAARAARTNLFTLTKNITHGPHPTGRRPISRPMTTSPSSTTHHTRHPRTQRGWRRTESNRRPPACKAGALPTELRPQMVGPRWWAPDGGPGRTRTSDPTLIKRVL